VKVTKVTVGLLKKSTNKKVALASVTLDDALVVKSLTITNGSKGLFVSMPQVKSKDGKWADIVFPINGGLRKEISNTVLEAYMKKATA
jgi:stage V sporulation protein G